MARSSTRWDVCTTSGLGDEFDGQTQGVGDGLEIRELDVLALFDIANGALIGNPGELGQGVERRLAKSLIPPVSH